MCSTHPIYGGDGDDVLTPSIGRDRLDGGNGSDTVDFSNSPVVLGATIRRNGEGKARAGDVRPELFDIERIIGTDFDDRMTSKLSNGTTLMGGPGDDRLTAKEGTNLLDGGADDDQLRGGRGNDTIRGGPGDDEFTDDGSDVIIQD